MEGGGIIHMHRTLEATIGGETLGLVLPSAGPCTPFGAPTTTNTAKAFVHFWVYAISHNGAQKHTNEDRRPTAIAWRRRRRGLLHLHHPLRLDHSSVLRVSRADLPTLPHHQLTLFHTEFFLGLLPATTLQPLPFREERDRRLSVCPALGRARTRG